MRSQNQFRDQGKNQKCRLNYLSLMLILMMMMMSFQVSNQVMHHHVLNYIVTKTNESPRFEYGK